MASESDFKIIRLFAFLFFAVILSGCANQLPPGGGIIDTIPPKVTDVYPGNGTVNYKGDYIELTFSEYVDKRTVQDAVFISPAVEGELEYDWSGTSVRIKFPEKLKDSLTYILTLGTQVMDINNRNKMAEAFSVAFSTGDKIDKGMVEGKVFADNPAGIMIYAYPLTDSTVNPSLQKPRYISQIGSNGRYQLLGLASGTYRIFAFTDEYRDLTYNVGEDSYGVPHSDITLSDTDTLISGLNFFMTRTDTARPRLFSASMTDRYHLLVAFSEPVDSTIIKSSNFTVIDSTSGRNIRPGGAFRGRTKRNELVLVIRDSLAEGSSLYLQADSVRDMAGNVTPRDYTSIVVSTRPDTTKPFLVKSPQNAGNLDVNRPELYFSFDDGIDTLRAKRAITVADKTGTVYSTRIYFPDNAAFRVKVNDILKPRQDYFVKIDLRNIRDAAGNRGDSTFAFRFTTTAGTDFSGVSGNVVPASGMNRDNFMVVLQGLDNEKPVYQQMANSRLNFNFNKVSPGRYIMWSYKDDDQNDKYSYGNPHPFVPAERFTFYPDTLNLRARWPVGDAIIRY